MEFIDHTGHIFSLPSYSDYPVGFEYETNDYIFWLDNDYSGRLSTDNYYIRPIRPLLLNATTEECCNLTSITVGGLNDRGVEETVIKDGKAYDIEHQLAVNGSMRQIKDIHITVDSQNYKLIASQQIQDLLSSNKNIGQYIEIDEASNLHSFLRKQHISIIDNLEDDGDTFAMIPFYVIGKSSEEGSWMTNVLIHVEYANGDNEWCPITVGGVFYNENETLVINGKNMGIDLPKDILKAIYQSSFYNERPDNSLYNDKIKELLFEYNHIKMGAGNFQSVIEGLKWFGYGNKISIYKLLQTDNEFLTQYLLDSFDISNDVLHSFKMFRNSSLIALQLADNQETDKSEIIDVSKKWMMGEGKPVMEDLFTKLVAKRYDEKDIVFYRPYYDFIFDELGLKLACLSYYYQKFFLPIHLSLHSTSIVHRVFANDIKFINKAEVKEAQYPILSADPNITVKFPGEKTKYLYNHKLYTDENYNVFSNTYDIASKTSEMAYYVNDVCVDIPIAFMSTQNYQYYDCVLLLKKEGKQIYESHFKFCQFKQSLGKDEAGEEKFTIENEYKEFVILPKLFNKKFNINYWVDKDYQICLLVNGNWYYYDFKIKLPEFQFNFGTLVYKYNVTSEFNGARELKPTDAEYVPETDPDWYDGINTRYDYANVVNYFRQVNEITDNGVDFNSFMYVPSLVEVNDINFLPHLYNRIQKTNEQLQKELNEYHESQVQISNIKFPLRSDDDVYHYGDTINGYFRLSVEDSSKMKTLTVRYRAFLNWHDYVKYMDAVRNGNEPDTSTVIYDCQITYDFINNTIYYRYPEYATDVLTDWNSFINQTEDEPYTPEYDWKFETDSNGDIIVNFDEKINKNLNFIVEEDGTNIHYKFRKYVSTNAVYNYIRSNDTFGTYDIPLKDDLGTTIIANGYLGLAVHVEGELTSGYKFEKLKYAEPPINDIEDEEESGDYCPFSEMCNDCCGNTCKYRRPQLNDRPKDDDGHYILTDTFNRSIPELDTVGKIDNRKMYSDLVCENVAALIDKYRESPVIVNNKKYLNRIHMYHLFDESGNMIRYSEDTTFKTIIKDGENCDKINQRYHNVGKDSLTPNKDYFFQDLYKQPESMISFYREFFWDNGDAKMTYPAQNYFDYDTYLMHDDDYWYVVFISTMTIDNVLADSDIIAQKTINYESQLVESGEYYVLQSGYLVSITDRYLCDADKNKIEVEYDQDGSVVNCWIKQNTRLFSNYYIIDSDNNYIMEDDESKLEHYRVIENNVGDLHNFIVQYINYGFDTETKETTYSYRDIALFDTKSSAQAYISRLKFDLESSANEWLDEKIAEERKHYVVTSSYNNIKHETEWFVYRYSDLKTNEKGKTTVSGSREFVNADVYINDENVANQLVESKLAAFASQWTIVNESKSTFEYTLVNSKNGVPIIDSYSNPIVVDNYGDIKTNKYTLKWQRSSNQFLINRMYFVDAEGKNQFDQDDLIVASIDNVNFPFIFETGSKWKFLPMSLGMSEDSCTVESNTNSAIISIGKGNKQYSRGYYDVKVRYSVDAFNQHQFEKKARILVK